MTTRRGDARQLVTWAQRHGCEVRPCRAGWRVYIGGWAIATVHTSTERNGLAAARRDIERGLAARRKVGAP
jgi:hypothetical protein